MTENTSQQHRTRDRLRSVLARIDALDSPRTRTLKLLLAYWKLRKKSFKIRSKFVYGGVVLLFCVAVQLARNYYLDVRFDRCLVDQPSWTQTFLRPVVDCSVCSDVQQVDQIDNVDPKVFEDRYAYSGRPVVVTDAASNWTAMDMFSFAFLKELYQDRDNQCQFFPYKTEFKSLRDVFNMSESRALMRAGTKPWYVGWSNCDEAIGSILREHYQRPYFLPDTAETEKTDWIFMGSPGYGAPMHVDDVEYPSWQAQIKGHKRWILEPPRECHYACSRLEVTVKPGEIIILDTNKWYHQTEIVSQDVSITIGAEYD